MAEPFSDEEIKKISDPEWNWQWEGYLEFHSGSSRIMKGVKIIGNRFLATITADRKELEKYRQGWLVKENEKLKKRIEELTKQAEIKDSLAGGVMTLAEVWEQLEDAKATIERLKALLGRCDTELEYLKRFTDAGDRNAIEVLRRVVEREIKARQALDAGKE